MHYLTEVQPNKMETDCMHKQGREGKTRLQKHETLNQRMCMEKGPMVNIPSMILAYWKIVQAHN